MLPALIAVASGLVLVAVVIALIRRRLKRVMDEVDRIYPAHQRILSAPMANYFGTGSKGMGQVRGNGVLLLTESSLYFRMLMPDRDFIIPVDSIFEVSTPRSFLGKSKMSPLLRVDFRKPDGGEDSAAWMVGELDRWVDELRRCAGIRMRE